MMKATLTNALTIGICLLVSSMISCSDQQLNNVSSAVDKNGLSNTNFTGTYFNFELDSSCTSPCTLSVSTDFNVYKVSYEADGFPLGSSKDASNKFTISYDFNQTGQRTLVAVAFSEEGSIITNATKDLDVRSDAHANGLNTDVPYYYQYNNVYSPSASCQNTSMAMILKYAGVDVTPDDITARHGKNYSQSPAGLADVASQYLRQWGKSLRLNPITNGTISGMKRVLDQGHPVIVHGYFTGYGHVLVITGYDQNGFYVNDPAGKWNQRFMGGYTGYQDAQIGQKVYYEREAFEIAISSSNGYNFVPLWYHELR